MPAYNSERYLSNAIESILNQTYNNFEFIVIYDESSDNSLKIVKKYMQTDNRFLLVTGEKKGLIGALNQGIEKASGKYIARMDADDISLPDRFDKQIEMMENDNADICGCHFYYINETGKYIDAVICPLTRESFLMYLTLNVPFAHGSVMMRRAFLKDNNLKYGSTLKHAEDYGLWIDFFNSGAIFCNVDDFLFKYRSWSSSISKAKLGKLKADRGYMQKRFILQNSEKCLNSCSNILNNYKKLTVREKDFLILFAYLLSKYCYSNIFFKTIFKSNYKNTASGLLKIISREV